MPEPLNLGIGGVLGSLAQVRLDFPRAFTVLTSIMSITPDFDPHVGYGAMQGPKLWFELDPTEDEALSLLTLANDDPYILYLLLKAQSFALWSRDDFLALDLGPQPLETALRFVRSAVGRRWGGPELTKRVKGYVYSRQDCGGTSASRAK